MKKITSMIISLLLIGGLVTCEMATQQEESDGETGMLSVLLTDAPFPIDMVSAAEVSIDSVVIRHTGESEEGPPFITLSTESETYNLLTLQNGVTATLAELEVPTGEYDLVRLYVEKASITLKNGSSYDVFVPSGKQTGIKLFIDPPISVQSDLTAELLLDLDVSKSFILRGNLHTPAGINGFNFKPVIRATNLSTAGRITGTVMDSTRSPVTDTTQVWAAQDTVVSNTFTDSTGAYTLIGLPEGMYTVGAIIHDDTVSISGVEVNAGNATKQDIQWGNSIGKMVVN